MRPLKWIEGYCNLIKQFDLELNTSFFSSEYCVEKIINFIEIEKNPSGFYDTTKNSGLLKKIKF